MKKILLVAVLAIIASCEKITTKNNAPDIEFAEELATKFYEEIINGDTLKIYNYIDKSIPKEDFQNLINENNSQYGKILNVDIKSTNTFNITKNGLNESEYKIEVEITYEKFKTLEYLLFTKNNNEVLLQKYLVQN
jgi:hypothetical protein